MKRYWTRLLPLSIALVALAAILVNGCFVLIEWYVVSPIGHGGQGVLQFGLLFGLVLFFAVLIALISVPALLFRKIRRYAFAALVCGVTYATIGFEVLRLGEPVRMRGFEKLAERSKPLVAAIHRYVETEGTPPKKLGDLVPRYLPEIPNTGMPAYPEYEYATNPEDWDGNPWVLSVSCTSGGINFDMFVYFPKQNYPEEGYGGELERVGDWAYVHE